MQQNNGLPLDTYTFPCKEWNPVLCCNIIHWPVHTLCQHIWVEATVRLPFKQRMDAIILRKAVLDLIQES